MVQKFLEQNLIKMIMKKNRTFIIAEIGNNHEGNFINAKKMILHAYKDQTSLPINVDIIKNNVRSDVKSVKYYNHATHNIFVKSNDQMVIFNDIKTFLVDYIS